MGVDFRKLSKVGFAQIGFPLHRGIITVHMVSSADLHACCGQARAFLSQERLRKLLGIA